MAKIVFQPKHDIRGETLSFSARLYPDRVPGAKGWYIHGHERTGQHYGGNYVRLVAWPNTVGGKRYTFSKIPAGWRTKRDAANAVKVLTRYVRGRRI